ncbi:MAG: heme exporter protein CcmB [Solirubrobacteraceae bacterium]|jgi:heme exporter protein B
MSRPRSSAVVVALLRAQLRLELRTFESLPAMCLFSVTAFVLFHFGLGVDALAGNLASGVLWVTLLLAALLATNRIYVADAEQGGFDAFLLSPAERSTMLVAKVLVLLTYLVVLELIALPAFAILLLEPSLWQALPGLLGALALGDLGIAVIGALVGALAVRTQARDLLGPLMSLPLLVPVLLCAASWSAPLFDYPRAAGVGVRWPVILALYDALFGLIAFALFDFLLED